MACEFTEESYLTFRTPLYTRLNIFDKLEIFINDQNELDVKYLGGTNPTEAAQAFIEALKPQLLQLGK